MPQLQNQAPIQLSISLLNWSRSSVFSLKFVHYGYLPLTNPKIKAQKLQIKCTPVPQCSHFKPGMKYDILVAFSQVPFEGKKPPDLDFTRKTTGSFEHALIAWATSLT